MVPNSWGAPTYTVSAAPSTVNLDQNVTITVSWNGGTAGASYTFKGTLAQPNGQGAAWTLLPRFPANSTGGGTAPIHYPQPLNTWAQGSRNVNTHISGTYMANL